MIKVDNKKCLKCSGCIGICPVNALALKNEIKCNEKCTDCGLCIDFCPIGAISLNKSDNMEM